MYVITNAMDVSITFGKTYMHTKAYKQIHNCAYIHHTFIHRYIHPDLGELGTQTGTSPAFSKLPCLPLVSSPHHEQGAAPRRAAVVMVVMMMVMMVAPLNAHPCVNNTHLLT